MLKRKTVMTFILGAMSISCAHKKIEEVQSSRNVSSEKENGTETGNPVGELSVVVKPNGRVELSGEEAKMFKSIFGTKKFHDSGDRGFKSVNCVSNSKCTIEMNYGDIYRSDRDEYNGGLASGAGEKYINQEDFVETSFNKIHFFKGQEKRDGEKFLVTPSPEYYYHDRKSVLKNDTKIYKMMEKSKSPFVTKTVSGDATILSAQTNNIKMTCFKTDSPQKASAGVSRFGKISLKYSCRTYFKGQATPLPKPIMVNTREARIEIYKLGENKELTPAKGVKIRQILDPNPTMLNGGTKQFSAYTNEAGVVQEDREMGLHYSDYKIEEASLVVKVEVYDYARKAAEIQSCKKDIDIRNFVDAVTIDERTNKVFDSDGPNTACGTDFRGTQGLKAGMNYPQMLKHPRVFQGVKNGVYEYESLPEVEMKCVLMGKAVYPMKGTDLAALESFDSGLARMRAACK